MQTIVAKQICRISKFFSNHKMPQKDKEIYMIAKEVKTPFATNSTKLVQENLIIRTLMQFASI